MSDRLPADLRLGAVHLTVRDLARSVAFYQDVIGLQAHGQEAAVARLGAGGDDLVVLHEDGQARPPGRHAGLYHVAYLFPDREGLARALVRLAAARAQLDGASDHGVSEALYLRDPDGNGIELYADRPREQWPEAGEGERVHMFTRPLDVEALVRPVSSEEPQARAGEGLVVGHVHLHVGDLDRALAFYDGAVGFDVMTFYPGAAFVAAGGYHHHLGLNTWAGEGVPGPPPHTAGLRHWTLLVDDVAPVRARLEAAGAEVAEHDGGFLTRDPWGTGLLVTTG